jgi:hypothetical protein
MGKRTTATVQKAASKPKHRSSADSGGPSLAATQKVKENNQKAHLHAVKTQRSYAGYLERGKKWLQGHFVKTLPDSGEEEEPDADSVYEDPEFRKAFDQTPNRHSDKALALFISYKCFHQNLKQSTGEGIHAAFKKYWEQA